MSTNVSDDAARDTLRREHGVRVVNAREEGSAAAALPPGVYGFTGSPVLASPLFAVRRYRNFEVHRLVAGVSLVGFVTPSEAAELAHPAADSVTVTIYPEAMDEANVLVSIPYNRIVQHRQYAIRNAEAIALRVLTPHAMSA